MSRDVGERGEILASSLAGTGSDRRKLIKSVVGGRGALGEGGQGFGTHRGHRGARHEVRALPPVLSPFFFIGGRPGDMESDERPTRSPPPTTPARPLVVKARALSRRCHPASAGASYPTVGCRISPPRVRRSSLARLAWNACQERFARPRRAHRGLSAALLHTTRIQMSTSATPSH